MKVVISEIKDFNRSDLLEAAISRYVGEPCRVCGEPITREGGIIFAGYSKGDKSRAAHGDCWKKNLPKDQWAYPVDSK